MTDKNQLSKEVLMKLYSIFDSPPVFDPLSYEFIYKGTKEQLKEAVKLLEIRGMEYDVDWEQAQNIMLTYVVIVKVDVISLKTF